MNMLKTIRVFTIFAMVSCILMMPSLLYIPILMVFLIPMFVSAIVLLTKFKWRFHVTLVLCFIYTALGVLGASTMNYTAFGIIPYLFHGFVFYGVLPVVLILIFGGWIFIRKGTKVVGYTFIVIPLAFLVWHVLIYFDISFINGNVYFAKIYGDEPGMFLYTPFVSYHVSFYITMGLSILIESLFEYDGGKTAF